MAGIYVHIPFCRAKCLYCNFFSTPSRAMVEEYLSAVISEIKLRTEYLDGERIDTIYFGGGTPSIVGVPAIKAILNAVYDCFDVSPDPEITLEANPDDITHDYLRLLDETEVNRLSIGIQSFRDEDLRYLGRAHDAAAAVASIERSIAAGYSNLTIDLIYGIPGLPDDAWRGNLSRAVDFGIPHISAYALTVECDTPLETLIEKGKRALVDEECGARQFEILMEMMRAHEYIHYEISNFCREGYLARHNSSYWKGVHYLGIGASAHSYDGKSRQWNTPDVPAYIHSIASGICPAEREELTPPRLYNEYVMTSLRTMWGMSLDAAETLVGKEYIARCRPMIEQYVTNGSLLLQDNTLVLTDKGKLIADRIIADLFFS